MALLVAVVWLLFTVVFPWVDRRINDPVLGSAPEAGPTVTVDVTG